MTWELDETTRARRAAADSCAATVLAPAAAAIDREAAVAADVRTAARAALAPPADGVAWAITIETLAATSATAALVAVADTLGFAPAVAQAQWSGLRGADVDGLAAHLGAQPAGDLAITALLLGTARAAVEASVGALRQAVSGGAGDAARPALSDAATALDAARLLLWDAARPAGDASARALARLEALEALPLAWRAAERALGADAFRPGAAIERARRDGMTLADVLGERAGAERLAAAGTLPG